MNPFLQIFTPKKTPLRKGRPARRAPLAVHQLEDRTAPAIFTVTTTADTGPGSLRQAITDANAATGADSVAFSLPAGPQTISLLTALATISGDLTINGTGATQLTVRRDPGAATNFRVFNTTAANTTFNNFTVSGGNVTGAGGGLNATGTVRMDGMVFTGNQSTTTGGAINIGTNGFLSLRNTTLSGNSTVNNGGGVYFFFNGGLFMENSTISGNTTSGTTNSQGGGGIYFYGTASAAPPTGFVASNLVVRNSTIHGNTAGSSGGGFLVRAFTGTLAVQNSTVTGNTANNTATNQGGGGLMQVGTGGTITVASSIVSGNTNTNGPDILNGGTTNVNFSAIGSSTGFTSSASSGNNRPVGENLNLGALQNNGGVTATRLPAAGSPVIDQGKNIGGGTTDQRGLGYVRVFNDPGVGNLDDGTDIGAVEVQPSLPFVAAFDAPNVTTAGATTYTFTVTYTARVGNLINRSTLGTNDITVAGPGSFSATPTFDSADSAVNATTITATYSFTPPGGSWDGGDGGTYTLRIATNEVLDTAGQAVNPGPFGSFAVVIPQTFVVINTNDAGAGSLRQALLNANTFTGTNDTIVFSPLFNTAQAINLTGGEIPITDSVTIVGPGSKLLSVNGAAGASATNRIFNVNGPGTLDVAISGVKLSGGNVNAGGGGAILTQDENLTLTDVTVTANVSTISGGGIRQNGVGTITLVNSTLSGNNATGGGGGIYSAASATVNVQGSTISGNTASVNGGGLYIDSNGTANIQDSTISGNTAASDGGGIYFFLGGGLTMTNSTLSGNKATNGIGGGMYFFGTATIFTIANTTISGNESGLSGGGIVLPAFGGVANIRNSTITLNNSKVTTAGQGGGGIARTSGGGVVSLTSTVVAGNTNANFPDLLMSGNTVTANQSAIGVADGLTITGTGNKTGTAAAPLNAMLGPLTNNGGPTLTHSPLTNSPLLNSGSNPVPALGTDQRGVTFTRDFGGPDIGAVEVQPPSVLSITTTTPSPTNASTIIFTVLLNQPTSNLSTSNFGLTTTGTVAGSVNSVGGTGTTWTVGVTSITGTGTLRVDLVNGTGATPAPNAPFTGGQVVIIDRDGPVVQSITLLSGNPAVGPTVDFLVTFNETVVGGGIANFSTFTDHSLTGTTVTNVTGTGNTRTVTVSTGTGNGNLGLRLSSGAGMADTIGNNLTAVPFSGTATYAVGQPVVNTFTGPPTTNAPAINYVVTFNQATANLSAGNFTLITTGTAVGTIGTPTTADGGLTWTIPVTGIAGDGSLRLELTNGTGTTPTIGDLPVLGPITEIDRTAPNVLTITRVHPSLTNLSSVQYTVTFDEAVVNVLATNFTLTPAGVTGAIISTVTGSGTTWTVTVNTGTGNGTITLGLTNPVGITDIATNPLANTLTGPTYTIDKTPPAVQSITLNNPALTNAQLVSFTVTFSEAILGLGTANFSLTTGGGVNGPAITTVTGSGTTWTVTVDTGIGNGTIRLNVQNSSGTADPAGNPITGLPFTGGPVYTIEKTLPFVQSIVASGPSITNAGTLQYTVTFSEAVTGVSAANFSATTTGSLANVIVTNVTGSGTTYTVTVDTGTGDGTVRLDLSNTAGIVDAATNTLVGTFITGSVVTIDKTPPTIQSIRRVSTPTTNLTNIDYTVTLSEAVNGLGVGNFGLHTTGGVTGAVILSVIGTGTTYTITVNTGNGDGSIRVDLATPAGVADPATNPLVVTSFPTDTVVIDKTPPDLVSIVRNGPTLTNAQSVSFTVTFSEPVTGLAAANFTMLVSTITGSGVSSITSTDGRIYTVTTNTGAGDGGLGLALTNTSGIVDPSGQNPPIGGSSQLFTIDKTRPAATINQANAQADPAANFPIAFTVVFTEQVTNFGADDVILTGTAPGGLVTVTGSGANYVVNVSGLTASGTVIVSIRANGGTDAAGNGNLLSTSTDNTVLFVRPAGGGIDGYSTPALVPLLVPATNGVLRNDADPETRSLTAVLVSQPAANQGTVVLNPDGSFRFTPAPGFVGTATFTYAPNNGLVNGPPVEVRIQVGPRTVFTAATAGKGGGPQVTVFNQDGTTRFQFFVYAPTFTGGVTVATGDVNGDGIDDIVTGAGAGGGPHVRVFDGRDRTELANFFAYAPTFTGGVNVAVGDLDGDGRGEVVIGSGLGGGPHVRVVNGDGTDRFSFFAYAPTFAGGVNVAVGDVNGDGLGDVVTGAGPGGGPHVQVFRGTDLSVLMSFFAFDKRHRGGAFVSVGDAFADGVPDVVVGSGVSREVWAVRGTNGTRSAGFEFLDTSPAIGTRVATEDTNNDGRGDVLMLGTGPNGPPRLRQVNLTTLATITDLSVFPEDFQGGLYVG